MKKVYVIFTLLVLGILAIVFFSQKPKKSNTDAGDQGIEQTQGMYVAPGVGDYDSLDTAIVVARSLLDRTISLKNLDTGRQYTLHYEGTTVLYDASGKSLSMEQILPGLIVDVSFLKNEKKLVSLRESTDAFVFRDRTDFVISDKGSSIEIGGSKYRLSKDLVVSSDLELVSQMDIHENDVLTIRGFDREVYSIMIGRGHGYLRLENDAAFLGGWIEVGTTLIRPITENMLLTIPEGTYDISVSNLGSGGTKTVTIGRGEEVSMDVGDLVTEVKTGNVLFELTPDTARVYIDGERVDATKVITLTYGIHQVIFRAEGYTTLAKYVKVGQEMATLTIELVPEGAVSSTPAPTVITPATGVPFGGTPFPTIAIDVPAGITPPMLTLPANPTQEQVAIPLPSGSATLDAISVTAVPSIQPEATQGYYVHIEGPQGVEVYVDGDYVGLAPLQFEKVSGTHEIILRKSGCQTRSYTLEIDDEASDISYSFAELRELTEN